MKADTTTATLELIVAPEIAKGVVRCQIIKWSAWAELHANRHSLTTGMSFEPYGNLITLIPVAGAIDGEITIVQAAELLENSLRVILPACKVYVQEARKDFEEDNF